MAKYLPESLGSIFRLRYPNFEVVVVNDGSTDGTEELVKREYSQRVIYLHQENRGLPAARNAGIAAISDADYYSIMDADDKVHPLKLWDEVALLERFPDVAICFSNSLIFGKDPRENRLLKNGLNLIGPDKLWGRVENPIEKIAKYEAYTAHSTIRATAIHAIGGYDETIKFAEDVDLVVRLTRVGGIGYINKLRYFHRREGQGMTSYRKDTAIFHTRIFEKVRENPELYSAEEQMLLRRLEKRFLWDAFKDIAAGRGDPALVNLVQREFLKDATWREAVKAGLIRCVMLFRMGKVISDWKAQRRRKVLLATKTISIEEVLNDMTLCFPTIVADREGNELSEQ
jgi:glycosyltransferase involved in cell wall biosynthesis